MFTGHHKALHDNTAEWRLYPGSIQLVFNLRQAGFCDLQITTGNIPVLQGLFQFCSGGQV